MDLNTAKDILEIIYYVTAGPLLLIVAAWGLKQISVAKKTSAINSKRDAFRIAAEQCTYFSEKIAPLGRNLVTIQGRNMYFQKKLYI